MVIDRDNSSVLLEKLCQQSLAHRRLIVASNRGPVEYYVDEAEQLQVRRGSGGIVTALNSLSKYVEMDWIASVMGVGDRQRARQAQGQRFSVPNSDNMYLRFVLSSRSTYYKYYSVICNPLLWFLQHYMWNSPTTPNVDVVIHDAWDNGYFEMNQAFVRSIVDEVNGSQLSPIIILNDYHLYLVSSLLRRQIPDLVIEHFVHIPWPEPSYWQLLPSYMRQSIFRGLCDADIVGLQTIRDVRNFLNCCASSFAEAEIDYKANTVFLDGHLAQVKAYPISVDTIALKQLATSEAVAEYEQKLRPLLGEKTIVRVDRAEPSKNIIRGFRSFDKLLERYPQFQGKIKFIAFLVPTRTHIRLYKKYMREVSELIDIINSKYGSDQWYPIDFFYENNYVQAMAGMRNYDVLLVNAVIDGMNLVAKEGPTVNKNDGVLILSETVGACEQLGENALKVAAADLEGTTEALYTALMMPPNERKIYATALKRSIEEENITNWLLHLLEDAVNLEDQCYGTST